MAIGYPSPAREHVPVVPGCGYRVSDKRFKKAIQLHKPGERNWVRTSDPRMEFEVDPAKSASNLEKHGIDFDTIQAIWQDMMRVEIPARTTDEPRWLVVGQMDGKHWSVVVTYRGSQVRIISARRSQKEEVALYEC
jgi:uncharacterized protein